MDWEHYTAMGRLVGTLGLPEGEAQGNGRPGAKQELTASPTLVLVKAMPAQEAAEFL